MTMENTDRAAAGPLPVSTDYANGLVFIPGAARDAEGRAALDPRIRRKLEQLELDSDVALALSRTLADRVRDAEGERVRLEAQREMLRANPDDDLARLRASRDAAQDRWQALAQLAERARTYLGLAR
jgi:hypothetical protein